MSGDRTEDLDVIKAPFGQEIMLRDSVHDGGATLLQVRIREGKRFTVFDVDARTAREWGLRLVAWADAHPD